MKLKGKKDGERTIRKWFALFPINIKGDKRWLEIVHVEGYWWEGAVTGWHWKSERFLP